MIKSEQKELSRILDSLDAVVYVADINTYELLYANKYTTDIFGDIIGKICWQSLQVDHTAPCDFCTNNKLLTPEGQPAGVYKWEFRNTQNGRWYEIRDRAIPWSDGRMVRLEIATDITDRKKLNEELIRSEKRYRTFIDSTADISALKDDNFRHLLVNKACEEFFNKKEVEIIEKTDFDLMPESIAEACRQSDIEALKSDGVIVSVEAIGDRVYEIRKFRVKLANNSYGVGLFTRDITQQKKAEEELKRYQFHLETLVQERTFKLQTSNELLTKEIQHRKQNEDKYYSLFNNMLNGFSYHKIVVDEFNNPTDYIFLDINDAFEKITGLKRENVIGEKVTNLIPGIKDMQIDLIKIYGNVALTGEGISFQLYIEPLQKTFSISAYSPEPGHFVSIFADITEEKSMEKCLVEIEERERRRIGHDLHDGLGQLLTGLSFKIRGLGKILERKSLDEAEMAADISILIDDAKEQASALSMGLAPVELDDEGLETALNNLSLYTKRVFKIPCSFRCEGPVTVTDSIMSTQLYRIAQEAVTNAVKHAFPDNIEIILAKIRDKIRITVIDNGVGIPLNTDKKGSMGLKIMSYRASIISASLDIHKNIDGGTTVTCIAPEESGNI